MTESAEQTHRTSPPPFPSAMPTGRSGAAKSASGGVANPPPRVGSGPDRSIVEHAIEPRRDLLERSSRGIKVRQTA